MNMQVSVSPILTNMRDSLLYRTRLIHEICCSPQTHAHTLIQHPQGMIVMIIRLQLQRNVFCQLIPRPRRPLLRLPIPHQEDVAKDMMFQARRCGCSFQELEGIGYSVGFKV